MPGACFLSVLPARLTHLMNRNALTLSTFLLFTISLSQAADPLQKVAKELGKEIRSLDKPRVAMLSFPYHNGKISSGSSILCERLTTYMAELKGIRLIERNLLKSLLEEQHLSETGIVDASAARAIGKVLDVDVIVTGTLDDLNDELTELNARAIKTGSGEVLAAAHATIQRTWTDRPRAATQTVAAPAEDVEEAPQKNEAIEIGYPAGGRGGYSGGYRR